MAPHPTTVTVRYHGKMLPVVKVQETDPYVKVDGELQLVRSTPVYNLEDGDGFGDNFIAAPRGSLGGDLTIRVIGHGVRAPFSQEGSTSVEVPLTATKTIKMGFAVIVFYSLEQFTHHPTYTVPADVFLHELPELPAGQTVKVKLFVNRLTSLPEPKFFIQIFDDAGREVRTTDADYAWTYYSLRHRHRFATSLGMYLERFKGQDHDAVPAVTPRPVFAPEHAPLNLSGSALLTIREDGSVSEVALQGIDDPYAQRSITEALEGWLFLPKLKAGQPVPVRIAIPLKI